MQIPANLTSSTQMHVSEVGQESLYNHAQHILKVSLLLQITQSHLLVASSEGVKLTALTKEAYAIYMSVKKLSIYIYREH